MYLVGLVVGLSLLVVGVWLLRRTSNASAEDQPQTGLRSTRRRLLRMLAFGFTFSGSGLALGTHLFHTLPITKAPHRERIPAMAMSVRGPQRWEIAGEPRHIEATYWLITEQGLQFTIHYPWEGDYSSLDEHKAMTIALPLMRHAYQHRLHKQIKVSRLGAGHEPVQMMRVELIPPEGRAYYFKLPISEIKRTMHHPLAIDSGEKAAP